jgi:DNA-directed RNA polymerase specialized sigma24 family protein
MHRLEGRKHSEIASSLGISTSAVEKHIAKAACLLTQLGE